MADRRVPLAAVLGLTLSLAGCQSDTEAVQTPEPTVAPKPKAVEKTATSAARLHYQPDLDFFYASVQEAGGDEQLEKGFGLMFYDHDLVGAMNHFLQAAAPDDPPETQLARAVGSGKTAWLLSRWFGLTAQLMAEANLGYVRDLNDSASRKMSQPPSDVERLAASRSAFYLGRRDEAKKQLEGLKTPEAKAWGEKLGAKAKTDPQIELVAEQDKEITATGAEAVIRQGLEKDWKTPTEGRLWDPYHFDRQSRAYLLLARDRLETADKLATEQAAKLEPAVVEGVHYLLGRVCYQMRDAACVSRVVTGAAPGSPLEILGKASTAREAGKPIQLADLGASTSALQPGLLAAQLAEGSPLEERLDAVQNGMDWATGAVRADNEHLWPATVQEAARISGSLRQAQAAAAKTPAEREELLTSALENMRLAEPDVLASKNEPLFVLQFALASLQRSGCSDLALASGMLHEKLTQQHKELAGPLWVLGGINTKNCAGDPSGPTSN